MAVSMGVKNILGVVALATVFGFPVGAATVPNDLSHTETIITSRETSALFSARASATAADGIASASFTSRCLASEGERCFYDVTANAGYGELWSLNVTDQFLAASGLEELDTVPLNIFAFIEAEGNRPSDAQARVIFQGRNIVRLEQRGDNFYEEVNLRYDYSPGTTLRISKSVSTSSANTLSAHGAGPTLFATVIADPIITIDPNWVFAEYADLLTITRSASNAAPSSATVGPSPIPVPASGLMLLTCLASAAMIRRRVTARNKH